MVYVIGNHPLYAEQIMDSLGIGKTCVSIDSYIAEQGDVPIMISTHGVCHGDSLELSRSLHHSGIHPSYKISFDAHTDWGEETMWLQDKGFKKMMHEAGFEPNPENARRLYRFDSHMKRAFDNGYSSHAVIMAIDDPKQISQVDYIFGLHGGPRSRVMTSHDVKYAHMISDEKIHVTLDLDAISGLGFIRDRWKSKRGPGLEETLKAYEALLQNNDVIALDIVGFHPEDLDAKTLSENDREGLMVYDALFEIIEKNIQ